MKSLQIKNLRSLKDTGKIEFRKINIFIGQNSSGKSSLIRTFPLLKQSAQVKTLSDILWYGPLVDFGSFDETLSRESINKKIEFIFELEVNQQKIRKFQGLRKLSENEKTKTKLTISIKPEKDTPNSPLTTEYTIEIFESKISVEINENLKILNLKINNEELTHLSNSYLIFRFFDILPKIFEREKVETYKNFNKKIIDIIKKHTHKSKGEQSIISAVNKIHPGTEKSILDQLKKLDLGTHWKKRISDWDLENKDLKEITKKIIGKYFCDIFEAVSESLNLICRSIHYITPIRATAERYYRIQGLAVDEIDPQGNNLAMFLKNLSHEEAEGFANWTGEAMGFEARAKNLDGHVSIVLNDHGSPQTINLADTGFGYSQVLPIIAQLWVITQRPNLNHRRAEPIFAIEQPELHLHPKMQSKLADLLIKLATDEEGANFKLAIETHSEILINQLGKAIEKNIISPCDVGIYIFEQERLDSNTVVRESNFDRDGYLTDWPIGFFDSE